MTAVKSLLSQMMGVVNHQDNRDWSLFKKISIAIDFGAAGTVIPHTLVTEYAIDQIDKSRAGV